MQVGDAHRLAGAQAVIARQQHPERLLEQRDLVERRGVRRGTRQQRQIERALLQPFGDGGRVVLDQVDADLGMGLLEADDEAGDQARPDRAHGADGEAGILQPPRRLGGLLGGGGLGPDLPQKGKHQAAEFGQMAVGALAVEQRAAQLVFELLDRPRERRLRDIAALGGAREIERFGQRHEVAHLLHFHEPPSPAPVLRVPPVHSPGRTPGLRRADAGVTNEQFARIGPGGRALRRPGGRRGARPRTRRRSSGPSRRWRSRHEAGAAASRSGSARHCCRG